MTPLYYSYSTLSLPQAERARAEEHMTAQLQEKDAHIEQQLAELQSTQERLHQSEAELRQTRTQLHQKDTELNSVQLMLQVLTDLCTYEAHVMYRTLCMHRG